ANAFIPDYLGAIGRSELIGTCLALLNAGQLPASFLLLILARRLTGRRGPLIFFSLLSFIGLAGILTPVAWTMEAGSGIVGFSAAFFLISALALPPMMAAPHDVHRL